MSSAAPTQATPPEPSTSTGGCLCCCCFSAEPLSREELSKSGYGESHPYCRDHHRRFQVGMKDACCAEPCCCLATFFTCTLGTNWCLRREVLDKEWATSRDGEPTHGGYYCCQGFAPCSHCLDKCVCCEEDGRCCCMCLECLCCPGLALSATRIHLMHEFELLVDPCDNQIIRFNNCIQLLACICDVVAIFWRPARNLARITDLIAHLVFMTTAGCMAAQIHHEKKHWVALAANDAEEGLIVPGSNAIEHSALDTDKPWGNPPAPPHAPPGYTHPTQPASQPGPPPAARQA